MDHFNTWRRIVIACMFFGYSAYLVVRKSFTFTMPALLDDQSLNLSEQDLGMVATSFMVFYSMGKFVCGVLSDKMNSRNMFASGLFLSGLVNIAFAYGGNSLQFNVLWALNGIFQGFGWAPCAQLIRKWHRPDEVGSIWAIVSAACNVASSLIPVLMATLTLTLGWRLGFVAVGIFACTFSLLLLGLVRDPSDVDDTTLPTSSGGSKKDEDVSHSSQKQDIGSMRDVLGSGFLWLTSFSYFLGCFLKSGLEDWMQLYLMGEISFSQLEASCAVMILQIGGFVGTVVSGYASDWLVAQYGSLWRTSPRVVLILLYTFPLLLVVFAIQEKVMASLASIYGLVFVMGFLLYGPQTLYGLVVMENAPPHLSGTAHAIAASLASVGMALAGYPLAYVVKNYSWYTAYGLMEVAVLVNSAFLLVTMTVSPRIVPTKMHQL